MTVTNNMLTQPQSYKLMRWLDDDHDMAARNTAASLGSMATATLGFKVTEHNIQSARSALGIEPAARGPRGPYKTKSVEILARELAKVMRALDIPVPADIDAIISHKRRPHDDLFNERG